MATYNKFEDFVEQLCKGVHQFHAAGHTFEMYLSNATPSASLDTIKSELAEIAGGNGYTAGGYDIENDLSETGGTATVATKDTEVITASGNVAQFRYAAVFNETQSSPVDPLVCWWDYGEAVDMTNGETFTVDYGAGGLFTLS